MSEKDWYKNQMRRVLRDVLLIDHPNVSMRILSSVHHESARAKICFEISLAKPRFVIFGFPFWWEQTDATVTFLKEASGTVTVSYKGNVVEHTFRIGRPNVYPDVHIDS